MVSCLSPVLRLVVAATATEVYEPFLVRSEERLA